MKYSKECNICNTLNRCYLFPCCKEKYICDDCLDNIINKCPFCRKKLNIDYNYYRVINLDNLKIIINILIHFIFAIISFKNIDKAEPDYLTVPLCCCFGSIYPIQNSKYGIVKYKKFTFDYLILNGINIAFNIEHIFPSLFYTVLFFTNFLINEVSLLLIDLLTVKKYTNDFIITVNKGHSVP